MYFVGVDSFVVSVKMSLSSFSSCIWMVHHPSQYSPTSLIPQCYYISHLWAVLMKPTSRVLSSLQDFSCLLISPFSVASRGSSFWAHLCALHGGLICVTFCLSVCPSVRTWPKIRLDNNSYLWKYLNHPHGLLQLYKVDNWTGADD